LPKKKRPVETGDKSSFVVGRASFEKICSVEGIRLTKAAKKRAAEAEAKGLSGDEYRRMVVLAHRKG
jgi:hypothetical protein